MQIPGISVARVGGMEQIVSTLPISKLMNYKINLAMENLYREGYRRFRAVPMPNTSDAIKYKVMGWPK